MVAFLSCQERITHDNARKVGIVGAGFAAAFHLRCYRQVQGVPVEVGAIVDINKARAEDLAKRYGVPKVLR